MNKTFDKKRPLSWSAISSFEYDPEQWYCKYVLGEEQKGSPQLRFGKAVADSIEDGTCTYPGLLETLQKKKEYEFKGSFNGIPLIGYGDAFCEITFKALDEVKTGVKKWDQKRADEHGQFDMYLLLNWIAKKVRPEDVRLRLFWLPTEMTMDGIEFAKPLKMQVFETKRTMAQVLKFGQRIKNTYAAMEEYCERHGYQTVDNLEDF